MIGPVDKKKSTLVQIMARLHTGYKPVFEAKMASFTDLYVYLIINS